MEYRSIEELLPRSGWSIYRLVRMAAIRALELSEGKPCLISSKPTTDKVTTIALEEIKQGKIEAKQAAEKRADKKKSSLN